MPIQSSGCVSEHEAGARAHPRRAAPHAHGDRTVGATVLERLLAGCEADQVVVLKLVRDGRERLVGVLARVEDQRTAGFGREAPERSDPIVEWNWVGAARAAV